MNIFSWLQAKARSFVLRSPSLRAHLTKAIYGDRDKEVNLVGTRLSINALRENGYLRVSKALEKIQSLVVKNEIPVMIHLALLLNDGDIFLDVGANIGLYSATLAKRRLLRPQANDCYAFEPNKDTLVRLRRNCEPLGVHVVPKAVSSRSGTQVFVDGAVSNIYAALEHATAMNILSRRSEVECVALDDLSLPGGAIVLKIDVEGQELEVLEGARNLFGQGRVKAVYVDGYRDPGVVRFLRGHGFELFDGLSLQAVQDGCFALLAVRKDVEAIGTAGA